MGMSRNAILDLSRNAILDIYRIECQEMHFLTFGTCVFGDDGKFVVRAK